MSTKSYTIEISEAQLSYIEMCIQSYEELSPNTDEDTKDLLDTLKHVHQSDEDVIHNMFI
ncbi:hypothetical protein EVB91_178 [Rhizobium phage RHph_I1_18]|nr:hypothetical protein EVB91_178 [Rhizobium phage RHph_I1_18]